MNNLKYFITGFLLLGMFHLAEAQYRYGYFRVGVSVGATNYLGDLDDDFTFKFTKPGVGVVGSYRFNPFMTAKLNFFQGWISGTDARSSDLARNRRNLSFRSSITEASFTVSFDFIPSDRSYAYRPLMTPYVFGGIGIFSFNPQAKIGGQWIELQPLGTEGQFLPDPDNRYPDPYNLTQLTFPIGAGMRFNIGRRWDLEVEAGWRKTLTDYLDDVSNLYPDLEVLRAQNPLAAQLSDRIDLNSYPEGAAVVNGIRGDQTQTDWYIYTNVTISFILDWVKCPTFK
ncbi:MAG: hypothetical protein D6730_17950 [Bacteroidetes bacterium]|nr:MAG: hypothetical protein D6730_17950 [Bacteroidota bacterium]